MNSKSTTTQQLKLMQLPMIVLILMTLITVVSVSLAWDVIRNNGVVAVAGVNDATPVGTSVKGYWTTPPTGYLLEDGAPVSRITYANLYAVIGTTFGAGDGSTTFNLPDSRSYVGVNRSSSDSEFDDLGETGGETTHTLTTTEIPSHEHNFSGQTISWGAAGSGNVYFRENGGDNDSVYAVGGGVPSGSSIMYTTSGTGWTTTNYAGGGAAHNNLQPYIVALRVIKY